MSGQVPHQEGPWRKSENTVGERLDGSLLVSNTIGYYVSILRAAHSLLSLPTCLLRLHSKCFLRGYRYQKENLRNISHCY